MATRWSSEFIVAEHRDLQASAMAIDWTGMYVLLAGRRYLGVKNLDDPSDNLRKFPRQSKYEVGTAEWNPSSSHSHLCAISSNQRVEVLSWVSSGELIVLHALGWHTRVISDLNWNRFDPNVLASCSIDTYTHIWDLRDARRPCISLSAVAGAVQVRWNRQSRYLLATAHNGDIKLWDQRKGTAPVQYITAHLANIHGLDWSPNHENQLATSSQDCTVKFFDITNPRRPENVLTAPSPVWRARYTPFGEGLLMVVVPPMRRGENSLLLWNLSNHNAPVHTFVGHTDVVLEFAWRRRKDDTSDYQLITWSKDQTLRIWKIEPFLQKLCGHQMEEDGNAMLTNGTALGLEGVVENGVLVDNSGSALDLSENGLSEQDIPVPSPTQPKTLQQEFSLINTNIRRVTVDKMDAIKRSCTVTAAVDGHVVILHVNFPPSYPYNAQPSFQFAQGTTVDALMKNKLLKVLKQTATQRIRKNRSCLEPCLRQLVTTLEQLSRNEEGDSSHLRLQTATLLDHSNVYSSYQDSFIPFPRTSGAKFCNVGMLVCFCRPPAPRRLSTRPNPDMSTPRALSALATGSYPDPPFSVSSFYFQDNRINNLQSRSRNSVGRGAFGKYSSSKSSKAVVIVYDASQLFYIHRELAEKYVFDWHNVPGMCLRNAGIAAGIGRRDLVQAWSLAALAATPTAHLPSDQDDDFPWPQHPFAKDMIQSLIAHYAQLSDIQMAAMLCCAFGARTESHETLKIKNLSKSVHASPGGSPYHTIHEVDMSLESLNFSLLKQNRSNSWSESLDDFRLTSNIVEHLPLDSESDRCIKMDESLSCLYDEYKRAYAEILHRWHLLDARAQVMKYISGTMETHKGIEFKTECQTCKMTAHDAHCNTCRKPSLQCVICHVAVRGSTNFCIVCGHGGHSAHMEAWFRNESVCPSGCGCHCLVETAAVLEP